MSKKGIGRPWHFPAAIYYQIGDSIGVGGGDDAPGYSRDHVIKPWYRWGKYNGGWAPILYDLIVDACGTPSLIIRTGQSGSTRGAEETVGNACVSDAQFVFYGLGINDAGCDPETKQPSVSLDEYEQNIREQLSRLITWGKRVILLGVMTPVSERTPPTDDRAGIEADVAARNSILRRIAAGFNDEHPDIVLYIEMEHLLTDCPEYTAMGDGVHPNHAGYEAYARWILTHLMG